MDYALIGSIAVNVGLVGFAVYKSKIVSAVDVLQEFKTAVLKVKAARLKASVESASLEVGIPQIIALLNVVEAPKT